MYLPFPCSLSLGAAVTVIYDNIKIVIKKASFYDFNKLRSELKYILIYRRRKA